MTFHWLIHHNYSHNKLFNLWLTVNGRDMVGYITRREDKSDTAQISFYNMAQLE